MEGIEPFGEYLIKNQESRGIVCRQKMVNHPEIVLIVKDVEIRDNLLIFYILAAKCDSLVKKCQCVTHRPICFLGQYMEGILLNLYTLFLRYIRKVPDHIRYGYPVEIVGLAP